MTKFKSYASRMLALLMVAVMCFGLTACSGSGDDDSEWSYWTEVSYVTTGSDSDDSASDETESDDDASEDKDADDEKDETSSKKTSSNKTSSKKTSSGKTSSKKTSSNKTSSKDKASSEEKTPSKDEDVSSEEKVSSKEEVASKEEVSSKEEPEKDTGISKEDLKGYTFTLMSPYLPAKLTSNCTGFEKNLFQRIEEVEEEYGCKIKLLVGSETGVQNLQPLISANKKVADVVEILADNVLPLARANYIIPWDDVEGVEIDSDKWVEGYTSLATFDGKHYGLQFLKPPEARMVVVFNKTLLKEKNIDADGLYDLVRNKKWTFDKLREYAQQATTVINGTTVTYGVGGQPNRVTMALTLGNNGRIVTYSGGKASATFASTEVINAVNFYNTLVNVDKVVEVPTELKAKDTLGKFSATYYDDAFLKGKTAFLIQESYVVNQQVKPKADFDYGIVPVPMGPDNKTGNYISSAGNARVFAMTSTNANNKDFEKSVAIFNALSTPSEGFEGNDWWAYDVKSEYFQKQSADDDFEMYQISLNTSQIDPGWRLTTLKDKFLSEAIYGPIFWNNGKTVQAGISGIAGTFDKTIDSVFNK